MFGLFQLFMATIIEHLRCFSQKPRHRRLVESFLQCGFEVSTSVFHFEQCVFKALKSVFHFEQCVFKALKSVFHFEQSVFKALKSVFHFEQCVFKALKSVYFFCKACLEPMLGDVPVCRLQSGAFLIRAFQAEPGTRGVLWLCSA